MDLSELVKKTKEQEAVNDELYGQVHALEEERDTYWAEGRKLQDEEDDKASEEEKSRKKLEMAQFRYERAVQREKDLSERKESLFRHIKLAQDMLARKKEELKDKEEVESDSACTHSRKKQRVKTEKE